MGLKPLSNRHFSSFNSLSYIYLKKSIHRIGFYLASTFLTLLMTKRLLAIASVALVGLTTLSWGQSKLEETRNIFQELVQSRQEIANEQSRWRIQKQSLLDAVELLELEIELLEVGIEEMEAQSTQAEKDRISLNGQIEELKEASAVVATVIRGYEQRVTKLANALPQEKKSDLESLTNRIPDRNTPESEIRASLGERMLNIVGLLDQMEVFNNGIHVFTEARKVGSSTVSLNVIYIGLGRAYYVNRDQGLAGYGTVDIEKGWTWTEDATILEDVDRAIRVFKSEIPAEFVVLPAK